jgi:hypothetical protein
VGCNKPARRMMEETVKVVENHEDGTGPAPWRERAEARRSRGESRGGTKQEWTSSVQTDGGAIFGKPMRGAWRSPGKDERKASRDADFGSSVELLRQTPCETVVLPNP